MEESWGRLLRGVDGRSCVHPRRGRSCWAARVDLDACTDARLVPDFGNPAGPARVPPGGHAVDTDHPDVVIGTGTPSSCTSASVVRAVARGGIITFDCGPRPVTITMATTAKVVNTSHLIVLDGGGTITLSGAGKRQILYMNTCDKRQRWTTSDCYDQQWPELVVQNMTFADGNSTVSQSKGTSFGGGGGGAIFDLGGQLKVVNSRFRDNRCYGVGPDLGGAAVRPGPVAQQAGVHHRRHLRGRAVLQRGGAQQHRGLLGRGRQHHDQ